MPDGGERPVWPIGTRSPAVLEIPFFVDTDYSRRYFGTMKTTVDIPDALLDEAMRHTRAKTKREAIVTAIEDFNRRKRMAALVKHSATSDTLLTNEGIEELEKRRTRKVEKLGK
jgi:Arc/MetJ family transcription regulator